MKPLLWLSLLALGFFLGFSPQSAHAEPSWLDRSHGIFLPAEVSAKISVQSEFPVLWWNFLVLENPMTGEPDWPAIQAGCQRFHDAEPALVAKIFCGPSLDAIGALIDTWTADLPRHHRLPEARYVHERMDLVLAKASLPIGPLAQLLRKDPLNSLQELQELLEKRMSLKLQQRNGFFYDQLSNRVLIPLQMSFPPSESALTGKVIDHLPEFCTGRAGCTPPVLIGAHASTWENEIQIRHDLASVSYVSSIILLILGAVLIFTGRWRLLLIVPPILVSILAAAALTVLVFGKIHGLTLAFGPAIVGLAIDFGLHVAFSNRARRLWRANMFGLLTTLSVLVIMVWSRIPLLQQLMFFSIAGLTISYFVQYGMFLIFPDIFTSKPLRIRAPTAASYGYVAIFLTIAAVAGIIRIPVNLDMRQLNYETPKRGELDRWTYRTALGRTPLLQVFTAKSGESPVTEAHEQTKWADDNRIPAHGIGTFLPSLVDQEENLATWRKSFCPGRTIEFSQVEQEFFKPFLERVSCATLEPRKLLNGEAVPAYLSDYHHGDNWLTLWLPTDQTETDKIQVKYPSAISVVDIAMMFPKIFAHELAWMTPAALIFAFVFLVIYYRRASLALLGVTPFFTGLGLYSLACLLLHFEPTFISIIGMIMVFGFSLDYGIFATDLMRRQKEQPDNGIWTGLTIATLTNIAGFTPLVFCKHPVLNSLGETLLYGTVGTYLGSIWGIPGLYAWLENRDKGRKA